MRRGRFSEPYRVYIVTTVTDQRIPWFQDELLARLMCQSLQRPQSALHAKYLCWVVMPDHVHVLLQLGAGHLSEVVRRLKGRSAAQLNREIGRCGRFWEPGFHDHALRRDENVRQAARYIIANPLRAGLVERVGDYPYWNATWL